MQNIDDILGKLTLGEKILLLEGYQSWKTRPVARLDLPAVTTGDGPLGVRKKTGRGLASLASGDSLPSTVFPAPVNLANSWNPTGAWAVAQAIGEECRTYDIQVLLGPGMNIKRDPRCGRNFEYFSEDPYLAGQMAAAYVQGLQSGGTAACPKHFAMNNNETFRYMCSAEADERTIWEIYLKPFEICVKKASPLAMMCSYNRINGRPSSENGKLLTDILRKEWQYEGLVMSDWGAVVDRAEGLSAGLNLDMPGGIRASRRSIRKALKAGRLTMDDVDRSVRRVLKLVETLQQVPDTQGQGQAAREEMFRAHAELAIRTACDSAVLLKNEGGTLPLPAATSGEQAGDFPHADSQAQAGDFPHADSQAQAGEDLTTPGTESVPLLVVGDLFAKMRYQGAGSSNLTPKDLVTTKEAFDRAGIAYTYVRGYREIEDEPEEALEAEALAAAESAATVLYFCGLTELYECEGFDRKDLSLPRNQTHLAEALAKKVHEHPAARGRLEDGPAATAGRLVIVLCGGSPFEVPFAEDADAILHMFLAGQGGGEACRRLLFGEAEPGGRLSETWMESVTDIPFGTEYGSRMVVPYKESIFVGYRYYDLAPEKVRWPFGYGLGYTTFAYSDLQVERRGQEICVKLRVTNTGSRQGTEVVQLYVGNNPESQVPKAQKELKAFTKLEIPAGACREAVLTFTEADLAYYHVGLGRWIVENGIYRILVGASSRDIRLEDTLTMDGYEAVPSPYEEEVIHLYQPGPDSKLVAGQITDWEFEQLLGRRLPAEPDEKAGIHITVESPMAHFQYTPRGRFILRCINHAVKIMYGKADRLPEGPERDNVRKQRMFVLGMINNNSPRSMVRGTGGVFQMGHAALLAKFAGGGRHRPERSTYEQSEIQL